ncbi:MAG: hypothetical protein HGA19_05470 [Oscillochloris sp.]|nr:hypothetical protein [Oscillochloris sp.]
MRRVLRMTLLLAFVLLGSCSRTVAEVIPEAVLSGTLMLRLPKVLTAGQPLTVLAERSDAPDGLVATLVLQGNYGILLYHASFQSGLAEFRLPAEDTHVAGSATLVVRASAAEGRAELTITPGEPIDPVMPLVGPRTIIADQIHWGTVVAIPFDMFGNPVVEGTLVHFEIQRPNAKREALTAPVTHLLAWNHVSSSPHAGRTIITATTGHAHGPDANLVETPGWPVPFTLSAQPRGLPADGRQFVTLRSQPIVDAYGNPMLDGTLITFVAEVPGGSSRFIPAYTIDGVAEAYLQAPPVPGTVTVRAILYGIESDPLRISFASGPAIGMIPVKATVDIPGGSVAIDVGPLLAALGQFVPESTLVHLTLIKPDGTSQDFTTVTEGGYTHKELRLTDLPSGNYIVEVSAGSGTGRVRFTIP